MNEELLAFVEDNAKWWDDAADKCVVLAKDTAQEEGAEWLLLSAVYKERASIHWELAAKIRKRDSAEPMKAESATPDTTTAPHGA